MSVSNTGDVSEGSVISYGSRMNQETKSRAGLRGRAGHLSPATVAGMFVDRALWGHHQTSTYP